MNIMAIVRCNTLTDQEIILIASPYVGLAYKFNGIEYTRVPITEDHKVDMAKVKDEDVFRIVV